MGAYRERLYPPLTTLGLFIEQTLSPDGACQDAVARYRSERTARAQPACSLNTGPYCKARQRLPLALIQQLALSVGARLQHSAPAHWRWHGRHIKLLDGTTVSMPDTAANQAVFPQSRAQQPGLGFPIAQLVSLVSLASGAVLGIACGPAKGQGTGEQALFRQLMAQLEPGDIVLADRYYCTYFTLALLQARGVDIVTRQHALRVSSAEAVVKELGAGDVLVRWVRPVRPKWMSHQLYAGIPAQLLVRQSTMGERVVVSTLHDAQALGAAQLHALYAQRWQIEVDLRAIKSELGMDVLRAKSPEMVRKELAVHMLAYNLVRWLMARAAALAAVLPRALSFKATVQLWCAFSAQWRWQRAKVCARTRTALLQAIATRLVPHRPARLEPHAIKRRPKPHALLTVPRQQAREAIRKARNRSNPS